MGSIPAAFLGAAAAISAPKQQAEGQQPEDPESSLKQQGSKAPYASSIRRRRRGRSRLKLARRDQNTVFQGEFNQWLG